MRLLDNSTWARRIASLRDGRFAGRKGGRSVYSTFLDLTIPPKVSQRWFGDVLSAAGPQLPAISAEARIRASTCASRRFCPFADLNRAATQAGVVTGARSLEFMMSSPVIDRGLPADRIGEGIRA
jgi:hypothetical protein